MRKTSRLSEEEYAAFEARRASVGPKPVPDAEPFPEVLPPPAQPKGLNGRVFKLTILGTPQPAGSKQAFVPLHPTKECRCDKDEAGNVVAVKLPYRRAGGGIMVSVVDANKHSKQWQNVIAKGARKVYQGEPVDCALTATFVFYVLRPQSHFGTGKNAGILKPSAPEFPTVKPDILKLTRGAEDALTGILYRDDSLIVEEVIRKRYGMPARLEVTIEEMPSQRAPEPTLPFTAPDN